MSLAVETRPLVDVRHLRHLYGNSAESELLVLDDVNLTLRENEIVGLLGRSGSGKSTLLRSIAGLISPSAGEIDFGTDPDRGSPVSVSMVFQSFALFPWLTVLKNVEIGLEAKRVSAELRRKRALAAIDLIGLDGFENAYPKELSGGMRQRVGLARALVVDPDVLLMDEPFSALDVLTAETLRTDLLDLWCEGRMQTKSILIVTHNIEEAVLMCDRILVFSSNPGRIVAEIKVELPQPRNRQDPRFRKLVDDIYTRMTQRTAGSEPKSDGAFPGMGIGMLLPTISTNTFAGLMEALAAEPFKGAADLPELGAALHYEADDLLELAETLQLFRFAEVEGGDIRLTSAARRYVEADTDARKAIFADQLLAYVPLATYIRRELDREPSHQVAGRRFRAELEELMSPDYAEQTLKSVVTWARYAEAFAYEEGADVFTLENPT